MAAVAHERVCAVCTNDFKTPKILPCGHLLCRQCVISRLNSKSITGCPLCTCPIVEHQGHSSQSSADVADALPTDYVMEAIVESARVLVKDDMCTVCDEVRAEYICIQCLEKMCLSCMKIHKKMVATRSHDVESLSTVTPERLAASRPALCADHGDNLAEMFCADHRLVICTSCGSNKHNECPDVKYLDVQMISAGTLLDSLTEELAKAEDDLKQAISNITVRFKTADVTEQKNMAQVDWTCDRLKMMVEDCRKQLKKIIRNPISNFKNSLCDVKRELETRLGKVTSHKHLVTRATTVRPRPALIHAAQTLTDRVHSLDLSADLEAEAWVNPSPEIVKYYESLLKVLKALLQEMHQQHIEVEQPVHQNCEANIRLTNCNNTAQRLQPEGNYNSVVMSRDAMAVDVLYEEPVLVFHENCGINIRLINRNRTAQIVELYKVGNSLILSRDAMAVNVLYEVRIEKLISSGGSVLLGVTRIPPAQFTVPTFSNGLKESVIRKYCVRNKNVEVGRRIGLLVDSSNNLHFYADGHDQGVAAKDVGSPCFAVFEFRYNVTQVTALRTSRRT